MCVYVRACVYACVRARKCVRVLVYVCACVRVCVCVCVYMIRMLTVKRSPMALDDRVPTITKPMAMPAASPAHHHT